jgi:protein-S-isoprenylcysteine O-methyltransferase Ste14
LALSYFQAVLGLLWLVWAGYWIVAIAYEGATNRTKETERRVGGTGFFFIILLFVMLPPLGDRGALGLGYFFPPEGLKVLGLVIVASGVILAIWARRHVGGNWSGVPSFKKGHELVTTRPYSVARHPIYTGILFGMLGSTLVLGTVGSLAVLVLASLVVAVRVRQEEGLMISQFGGGYEEYRGKTKAIIPWLL